MKKILLLCLFLAPLFGIIRGQNLIRVNNNPGADADYLTLQEANDNASNGDMIYVEGSTTPYEGANLSRRLVITGPGYFLSENDSTQANGLEAVFNGAISFNAGSEGSNISGCNIYGNYINILVDDIVVSRCHVYNISLHDVTDNILITQNYTNFINIIGTVTNSIISNNYVGYQITAYAYSGPLQVINNVIEGASYTNSIDVFNSSIANNIICATTGQIPQNTGNTITNNILARDGTNANGNQYNVVMANVFVDFSGTQGHSSDGRWKLKAGSPAIGAGVSGVDCGMFGGVSPYVLSGLPALPHIYEAAIPGTAYSNEGLPVSIKVKAGK
jgi:hypothetical protein